MCRLVCLCSLLFSRLFPCSLFFWCFFMDSCLPFQTGLWTGFDLTVNAHFLLLSLPPSVSCFWGLSLILYEKMRHMADFFFQQQPFELCIFFDPMISLCNCFDHSTRFKLHRNPAIYIDPQFSSSCYLTCSLSVFGYTFYNQFFRCTIQFILGSQFVIWGNVSAN